MSNKNIRFPTKCYVGMIAREEDSQPLGFLTEWGEDKAALKRMETVDRWVAQAFGKIKHAEDFPTRIYDNIPMAGYRIGRSVKRDARYGSGNVVWRIEDPRGFDLEISSQNMAQILLDTVNDRGEILDQCIWARSGANNVLVPVSSELYLATVENTARMLKSVKPSMVKLGNRIILQNGVEGIYLGKLFHLQDDYRATRWANRQSHSYHYGQQPSDHFRVVKWSDKALHTILRAEGIYTCATMKVAEILCDDVIEPTEAEQRAGASFARVPIGRLEISPTTYDDVFLTNNAILTEIDGKTALARLLPYLSDLSRNDHVTISFIDRQSILEQRPRYLTIDKEYTRGYGGTYMVAAADTAYIKFQESFWRKAKLEKVHRRIVTELGTIIELSA